MSRPPSASPLVTLGVPVHNGERHLPETLNSLRSQDHENLEIVISDNGSTDATPEICLAAAARDDRIRYLGQPEDRGRVWNLNHVIDQARGEFFTFAAADDVLRPTLVSTCVSVLDRVGPEWVLALPRACSINADSEVIELLDEHVHIDQPTPHERLRRCLRADPRHILCALMRTDVLRSTRGVRPGDTSGTVLMIEMACRGKFAPVPEQLLLLRDHAGRQAAADEAGVGRSTGDRFAFPSTMAQLDRYRAVVTSPLTYAEKAQCLRALTTTWTLPGSVTRDVARALGR